MITQLDYLASCFGATVDLLSFWKKADYLPIKMGTQRNASSGEHSVVVFNPISKKGSELLILARKRFFRQFPHQLADALQDLEPDLAAFLLQSDQKIRPDLDEMDREDIKAFIRGERIYEACPGSLKDFILASVKDKDKTGLINNSQRDLLISKVLQKKSWIEVAELTKLKGKSAVIKNLQRSLQLLMGS